MSRECISHHYACDCRERQFAEIETNRDELLKILRKVYDCANQQYESIENWDETMKQAQLILKENEMFGQVLKVQYMDSYDLDNWGELKFAKDGDACFDIRITEDRALHSGIVELVGTGIKTAFNKHYVLHIFPRSGTACKRFITLANSPATIDSGYRGEIKLGLLNFSPSVMHVKRGERVAQARLCPVISTMIIKATELSETERGDGGFGSTGK